VKLLVTAAKSLVEELQRRPDLYWDSNGRRVAFLREGTALP
jgi:hypothetical protein